MFETKVQAVLRIEKDLKAVVFIPSVTLRPAASPSSVGVLEMRIHRPRARPAGPASLGWEWNTHVLTGLHGIFLRLKFENHCLEVTDSNIWAPNPNAGTLNTANSM